MSGKEGDMDKNEAVIRSACPLYVCRLCRTKTGWPHQCWCELRDSTEPGCADCRYHDALRGKCAHPAKERRDRDREKHQRPLRA